jgi:hypothetical membrane protein
MTTDQSLRRLATAGVAGPLGFWVVLFGLGGLTPGYSPVDDYISTLGGVGAPYAVVQQGNFVLFGASILAFGVGLHRYFGDGRRPRAGTVFVGLLGLGILLAGPFQSDPAAPESKMNVLHDLVSTVAFVAGVMAVGLVSRRLDADDRWPRFRFETPVTVAVVLATFVGFAVTIDAAWVGLTQRLMVGAVSLWVVVQSARLYRLAGL